MSDALITGPFSIGTGRRQRWPYVKAVIIQSLILVGCYFGIANMLGAQSAPAVILRIAISLAGAVFYLGVSAQRCRDCGWPGWFCLLTMIPVLGLIPVIGLLVLPGKPAEPSRESNKDQGSRRRRHATGSGSALVSAALAGHRNRLDQTG